MTSVTQALKRVEGGLVVLGRAVTLGELQPGLPSSVLSEALAQVGLTATADLLELYGWRDGTRDSTAPLDDLQILPGFYFLSLADALSNYTAFVADPRWQHGWFPLYANGGGDFFVVDLAAGDGSFGQVRHFRIDETEHPVEFASITDMLGTMAEAYERGVFFVDQDGYLEMDDVVFADLAARLNPGIPWWTD